LQQTDLEAAFTSTAPMADSSFSEKASVPLLDGDVPSIVKRASAMPNCPPILLVILSGFFVAAQGFAMRSGEPGRVGFRSPTIMIAGAVGAVIGLILAGDYWFFRKQLNRPVEIPVGDAAAPDLARTRSSASEWMPISMLILPVFAGLAIWNAQVLRLDSLQQGLIGSTAVIGTAILGYFSTRQMALSLDRDSTYQGPLTNPAFVYLSILGFWIICYPIHFVTRWRMGGRNLIGPGLIATAVYCAPMIQPFLVDPELPAVDHWEVISLVKDMVSNEPRVKPANVQLHVEVSFDAVRQERVGRCTLVSEAGDEPITYTITWQDRRNGRWLVQIVDRLPPVNAPEVIELVKQILRDELLKHNRLALLEPIMRNPVQIRYDRAKHERLGKADVVFNGIETTKYYLISWEDERRTRFHVNIFERQPWTGIRRCKSARNAGFSNSVCCHTGPACRHG
jgi:hypothetical protein